MKKSITRRPVKNGAETSASRLPVARMLMRKVRRNAGPSLAVRKLVLERDGFSCVCCGTSVIGRRYSLLRRVSQGPDRPENLITVLGWGTEDCCGRIYLFKVRADKAKGYRLAAGEDPANEPMVIFTEDGGALVWLTASGIYSTEPPLPRTADQRPADVSEDSGSVGPPALTGERFTPWTSSACRADR